MRQREASRLRWDDADPDEGTLVIGDSKFGKSRTVFTHPTPTWCQMRIEGEAKRVDVATGTANVTSTDIPTSPNSCGGPLEPQHLAEGRLALTMARDRTLIAS